MEAYKIRFIKEYDDLIDKYVKLNSIIKKYYSNTLDFKLNCPIELLIKQYNIMWDYIEVLYNRSLYENINLLQISKLEI